MTRQQYEDPAAPTEIEVLLAIQTEMRSRFDSLERRLDVMDADVTFVANEQRRLGMALGVAVPTPRPRLASEGG